MFEETLEELRESAEFDAKGHPRVEEYYHRVKEGCEEEDEEMDTQEDEDLVMGQVLCVCVYCLMDPRVGNYMVTCSLTARCLLRVG